MSYRDKSGKSGTSHAPKRVTKYCWGIGANIEIESGECMQTGCTHRGEEGCIVVVHH